MSFHNRSPEVSMRSNQQMGYVDAALSVFQRPQRSPPRVQRTPSHQSAVSTVSAISQVSQASREELLHREPSIIVNNIPTEHNGDPWVSGFFRRLPYTGVLALLMVLLCAGADVVVLYKSDGQEVDSWKVSPSVLLAVFSATANVCLEFARSEGVILAWWRKALHGGTLYDLSRYWESGDSILGAVKSGRGFNVVAVATVIASAIVLDGPLLQQASTIVSKPTTTIVNVTAPIAQEIPYGSTATANMSFNSSTIVMNKTFSEVVSQYISRQPITTSFTGCSGKCSGVVMAPGLAINCSMSSSPWNSNQSANGTYDSEVFNSTIGWRLGGTLYPFPGVPIMEFDLASVSGRTALKIADTDSGGVDGGPTAGGTFSQCNGTKTKKHCSLRSATLKYPVTLINGTISITGNSSGFEVDHVQPYGVYDEAQAALLGDLNPRSFMTLGGVQQAAQHLFESSASQQTFNIELSGSLAGQYADYGPDDRNYIATQDACSMNWNTDPTDEIMNALNEIMFRTGLATKDYPKYKLVNDTTSEFWRSYYEAYPISQPEGDTGIPVPQMIAMEQFATVNIFQSHYSYLAAALGVMVVGVLVVLPTFNGFWELGRATSLNPLEIAKAFNPDILQGTGSNASSTHLDKAVGNRQVKYGEVIEHGLSVGEYGYGRDQESGLRCRKLELADPSRVKSPEFQGLYS